MLPESNNIYGLVDNKDITKSDLADKFKSKKWAIRKSSWVDFEVSCEWCEIEICGENEIILNGIIKEEKFDTMSNILKEFQLEFTLELYGSDGTLDKKVANIK